MKPLLTNQSLQEFIEAAGLPEDKKKEYIGSLSNLDENGRLRLFDTLTAYYELEDERNVAEKAVDAFARSAEDGDYENLDKALGAAEDMVSDISEESR